MGKDLNFNIHPFHDHCRSLCFSIRENAISVCNEEGIMQYDQNDKEKEHAALGVTELKTRLE